MSRKLWVIIILALISLTQAIAKGWQDIQKSGELRVGIPGDYAPLAFFDTDGNLIGYDIDMARSLGKTLKLNVTFVITSWPTISADLAADKFDIAMGGVTATPTRATQFALSDPVLKNGKVTLTQCNQANQFPSLETIDRPNVRVIVNPGGTNEIYVDTHIKSAQIIRTRDNVANLQGIRDGSADIMFTDQIEGIYYQSKEPGTFCLGTSKILPGTSSYKTYMMSKDNTLLLNLVNQWLEKRTKLDLARQWNIME